MNAYVATAIGSNGAGTAKEAAGTPLEELFDGVDDLIRRVADTENPEIRKIRAKVHAALVAAKRAFEAKGAWEDTAKQPPNQVRRPAAQALGSVDDALRDYPGPALSVALLVGLGLGLVVSLRE
jgi:ElaB/YqjD/DUF883 family membrane-anchored ribosome-binding protein